MGLIYSRASVTIIAAAGEDAGYGLPGCGRVPRRAQHHVEMDGWSIFQIYPRTSDTLRNTKWATRAWTYQECYLSCRRLVFTNEQITYICNEGYAYECLKELDSRPLTTPSKKEFTDMIPPLPYYNILEPPTVVLMGQIEEYSRRQLTFEEDSLNAFLGVLKYYETYHGIKHLWGLPIVEADGCYAFYLEWVHNDGPVLRRTGFPSWSWTGWAGGVGIRNVVDRGIRRDIFVGLRSGGEIPFSTFIGSNGLTNAHYHREAEELIIDGFIVRLSFSYVTCHDEPTQYIRHRRSRNWKGYCKRTWTPGRVSLFDISPGLVAGVCPFLDTEMELKDGMFGLVLDNEDVYTRDITRTIISAFVNSNNYLI
ncbi:hypothetical protein F4819DRAFT_65792 [Hypoxylon fuscum]|nr:hypothetical protein F4819DRAFT_65792 [Hypoxylon fuscum]